MVNYLHFKTKILSKICLLIVLFVLSSAEVFAGSWYPMSAVNKNLPNNIDAYPHTLIGFKTMVTVRCIETFWDAIRAKPKFKGLKVEFRGNWKNMTSGPPYNGRKMADWPLLASHTLPQLKCDERYLLQYNNIALPDLKPGRMDRIYLVTACMPKKRGFSEAPCSEPLIVRYRQPRRPDLRLTMTTTLSNDNRNLIFIVTIENVGNAAVDRELLTLKRSHNIDWGDSDDRQLEEDFILDLYPGAIQRKVYSLPIGEGPLRFMCQNEGTIRVCDPLRIQVCVDRGVTYGHGTAPEVNLDNNCKVYTLNTTDWRPL